MKTLKANILIIECSDLKSIYDKNLNILNQLKDDCKEKILVSDIVYFDDKCLINKFGPVKDGLAYFN